MTSKRALVVGLGIAGMATALRLHRIGWEVVILEKAPERRRGGHFISLFGAGVAAAKRLGIDDDVPDRTAPGAAVLYIDRQGRRTPGLPGTPGRPRRLVRGDVENAAFRALPADVEIRYSSSPYAVREDGDAVEVGILNQETGASSIERFDLVVGADGLRSTVRQLAFEPASVRMLRLGYMIASFSLTETVPGFRPQDTLKLPEDGRSVWVFSFADRPSSVLYSYRTADIDAEFSRPPIESLRRAFEPQAPGPILGWLLDRFDEASNPLFDSAEQVHLDRWRSGRVVLVGDAAWCLTLYSGMGASAALAGADLLGTMLERHGGDISAALDGWERHLRPFIAYHVRSGVSQRRFFTPKNRAERLFQSTLTQMCTVPVGRKLFFHYRMNGKEARMKAMDIAAVRP